jgi:hypothetical protein
MFEGSDDFYLSGHRFELQPDPTGTRLTGTLTATGMTFTREGRFSVPRSESVRVGVGPNILGNSPLYDLKPQVDWTPVVQPIVDFGSYEIQGHYVILTYTGGRTEKLLLIDKGRRSDGKRDILLNSLPFTSNE